MRRNLIIVMVIAAIILPSAFASLSCPCSRPGAPGKLIRVDAQNGTANNVNLYAKYVPKLGETLNAWATKEINLSVIPVNNLSITVYLGGEKLANLTTDRNGWFSVIVSKPGEYGIYGGDSEMHFNVSGAEEIVADEPVGIDLPPFDESNNTEGFGNDSEIGKPCTNKSDCKLPWSYAIRSSCPYDMRCAGGLCEVFCPWDESVPEGLGGSNGTPIGNTPHNASDRAPIGKAVDNSAQNTLIVFIIAAAIAIAAGAFALKRKKCCQRRKSSGI